MSTSHCGEAVNDVEGTAEAHRTLVALIKAAFPHRAVPDSAYERAADTVLAEADESAWLRATIAQGLDSLQGLVGGRFDELDPDQAHLALLRVQNTTFFGFIRQTVVVNLYEEEEVWEALGYEGPSFDKGGYIERGFDDLDWLPEPRIEEYDGDPLQDVVSDLPTEPRTDSTRGAAVPAGQSKARSPHVGSGRGAR